MLDEISPARTIEDALRQCELPRLTDIQLEALEEIALLDRTLEPIAQSIVSVTREVAALRSLVEVAQADAQRYKQDHLNACGMIADLRIDRANLRAAVHNLVAIARSLATDQDQTERARIDALEKVLDAPQETPTR